METVLPILLVFGMAATVVVLVIGIVSFAFNGAFYQRNSNLLMRWRVGLQGLAIAILGLMVLLSLAFR